jgi:hypothetical protein
MGVPGGEHPHPYRPVWTHPLLQSVDDGPLRDKLGGPLKRLALAGWTDRRMNEYLALTAPVAGSYHAIVAADFCAETLPGITPGEVAAWALFLHDPAMAEDAETPTEALYYWMTETGPAILTGFARAARGDHALALLALRAGLTMQDLAQRVAAGEVDREGLRLLAGMR